MDKNNNFKSVTEIITLIENKEFDIAKEELIKIIDLRKNNFLAHQLLGKVQGNLDNTNEGIKHLEISLNINPINKGAIYELALIYFKNEKYDHCKKLLLKAIEIDPKYLDAYILLGGANEFTNNISEAKKYYDKVLNLDEKFIISKKPFHNFLMKMGAFDKAQFYKYKHYGIIRFEEKQVKII